MAWKGHQNVGDGWTGWVEVTDLSIQRVDGEIVGKSRHRFSARNDGNQEGNFAVTYNLVLQSWVGQDDGDRNDDRNWGFFKDDKQTHPKPTAARGQRSGIVSLRTMTICRTFALQAKVVRGTGHTEWWLIHKWILNILLQVTPRRSN